MGRDIEMYSNTIMRMFVLWRHGVLRSRSGQTIAADDYRIALQKNVTPPPR
jgi:hypothetical protein